MASRTRSDAREESGVDPLRPSDHIDSVPADASITQPRLGVVGYLRFFWRQLTSMRTALILLLLLALAAVPGSLVPQRSSDPNGVVSYKLEHPDTYPVLDALGVFSTFSTPWFSAIYLLLFVSLVGCIIPRTKHHFDALRARPPKTPAHLERLIGFTSAATTADAETAVEAGRALLRRQGYRVQRYGMSISAERGYLRETGNLIFHTALVGVLLTVGIFGSFGYTGQRVLVQNEVFTNLGTDYDSFNPGRFVDQDTALQPFQIRLDKFTPSYTIDDKTGVFEPADYDTKLSTRLPGGSWTPATLKVNDPVSIGGTLVYLLGNGYAPIVTIRAADGTVVKNEPVPFLPQDANLTSIGVIKVADGLTDAAGKKVQVGINGFFRPTPDPASTTNISSVSPYLAANAALTLTVYTGDLGLDKGTPVNVYSLNTDKMTEVAGATAKIPAITLTIGKKADLPNGMGTVEFSGIKRFVSLDVHHDPTPVWALLFAVLVLGGLLLSLFIPRRRVWIKATTDADGTRLEYAGLARGEDPNLAAAVSELAARHRRALGDPEPEGDPHDDAPRMTP